MAKKIKLKDITDEWGAMAFEAYAQKILNSCLDLIQEEINELRVNASLAVKSDDDVITSVKLKIKDQK